MFKKYSQLFIIALPILILLTAGIYYAYINWNKYTHNNSLKTQLEHTKLLQSLEYSVLNEIVCVATMSQNPTLMEKVCNKTKKTTDSVIQEILTQTEDSSLHTLEKIVQSIRNSVQDQGNIAVEKLVNGDLDKEMNTFIRNNNEKLKYYNTLASEEDFIEMYTKMSDISYATASEKALVSYYLALQKVIPAKNLIYWDKMVSRSDLLENDSDSVLDLNKYIENQEFQALLRQIEDVRIDIMSHASTGIYKYDVATWVGLLNQKQKVLTNMETMLLGHIYEAAGSENQKILTVLLISVMGILLSLLSLWFVFNYLRNRQAKNNLLSNVVKKVAQYDAEGQVINVSDTINSQKMAYDYISSSFEKLQEKESKSDNDNKINAIFLNNMSYEIRAPLNGISGYTKLLKETPLNLEQSDYVSVIENSFENLDSILSKMLTNPSVATQKLEIENDTFDIVKKVELAIETYTVKADQKDILLGVYIDPTLAHQVKGDGTKISQILTNMIDNALESSKAYDAVNIFVDKIHSDDAQVSVKFSITDEGIGYSVEELEKIYDALESVDEIESIVNFDTKNLSITNKILKRMGGKLELNSNKGEGTEFFFTLNFEKDIDVVTEVYPTFDGMKVGLALPIKDIDRQVDQNLEKYVEYLGAEMKLYYYDTLFGDEEVELPEVMFFYHHYARLEGELEAFSNLKCKTALITTGTLRSRINSGKYDFSSMVYGPMTMRKVIRIFAESKLDNPVLIENVIDEPIEEKKGFENLRALVVEDNKVSQKIIEKILKNFSMDVTLAENGLEGFELRKEKDFDIIFMDMEMPVMDGYQATSKILYYEGVNQLPHVPIISLSADKGADNQDKRDRSGIDEFIHKPYNAEQIHDIIQKYCVDLPTRMKAQEEDDFIAKVLSEDFLKVDLDDH